MFIIKNSYISHCGKKPPPAHCGTPSRTAVGPGVNHTGTNFTQTERSTQADTKKNAYMVDLSNMRSSLMGALV